MRTTPITTRVDSPIELQRKQDYPNYRRILQYRKYAMGDQPLKLTEGQKQILEGLLEKDGEFADNICHQIIAEYTDRIHLMRWRVTDTTVQEALQTLWVLNRVSELASEAHYAAARDGDYCLLLGWDNESQRVTIHKEPWWDGDQGMFVQYDGRGNMLYAVKEWNSTDGRRQTRYYNNRIERYKMTGVVSSPNGPGIGWQPYNDSKLGLEQVEAWTKPDGSPLHIPVIHFANAGRGPVHYGVSELSGGVIGFQNQINDLQWDLTGGGRMTGYQMLWMSGVTLAKDATGNDIQPTIEPGAVFVSANPLAKYGHIPAGDLSQMLNLYDMKIGAVCRMTRTPRHLITGGDWPAGEALMRAEMPLINKVRRGIEKFRPVWVSVAHRAIEIMNAFGGGDFDENATISAEFIEPEDRDPIKIAMADATFWQAAEGASKMGVPLKVYLRRRGWTEEELKDIPDHPTIMEQTIEREKQAAETAKIAASRPEPKTSATT